MLKNKSTNTWKNVLMVVTDVLYVVTFGQEGQVVKETLKDTLKPTLKAFLLNVQYAIKL